MPEDKSKKTVKKGKQFSNIFIPILVENKINGLIGISGEKIENKSDIEDILRIASVKISSVLTNATLHRNTKR